MTQHFTAFPDWLNPPRCLLDNLLMLISKDFIALNNSSGNLTSLDCTEETLGLVMESCGPLIASNSVAEEMAVSNVLG